MTLSCNWVPYIPGGPLPVYLTSSYQSLLAEYDGARAVCVRIAEGSLEWYLPMLLRGVGGGAYEAYTAYGYGGLWNKTGASLPAEVVETLRRFLASHDVICAFIRHSPFLDNQEWLPQEESEFNRTTYIRALSDGGDLEVFCANSEQKLRWSINCARRHGLATCFHPMRSCDQDLIREFYRIYRELMDKKDTGSYYLFSEEFFLDHARYFGDSCELAAMHDPASGKMIAAAFFLQDETGWVHYHLSASLRDSLRMQPVELLMAEAILRYGNAGYRNLHLGGGHAADGSDGLSRFKKKFATDTRRFHLSRWICDGVRYQAERERLPLKNPGFFLINDARGKA